MTVLFIAEIPNRKTEKVKILVSILNELKNIFYQFLYISGLFSLNFHQKNYSLGLLITVRNILINFQIVTRKLASRFFGWLVGLSAIVTRWTWNYRWNALRGDLSKGS